MTLPTSSTGFATGNRMTGGKDIIPKGYAKGQLQQFSPEQMQLFQSLFSHLQPGSFLSRLAGGDQSQFEQLEAPTLRQLGEFQGQLASRFSGLGSGARRSSGHALAQGQLASDFAEKLRSQRLGLQQQAIQDLLGLSGQLLGQRPYEDFLIKKEQKPSIWESLIGGGLPIAGAALGGAFGGLPGAKLGSTVGAAASKGFFG